MSTALLAWVANRVGEDRMKKGLREPGQVSTSAHLASERAKKGQEGAHEEAAKMHEFAAHAHEQAAKRAKTREAKADYKPKLGKMTAQDHLKRASEHREAAETHSKKAGSIGGGGSDDEFNRDDQGRFASK